MFPISEILYLSEEYSYRIKEKSFDGVSERLKRKRKRVVDGGLV